MEKESYANLEEEEAAVTLAVLASASTWEGVDLALGQDSALWVEGLSQW